MLSPVTHIGRRFVPLLDRILLERFSGLAAVPVRNISGDSTVSQLVSIMS